MARLTTARSLLHLCMSFSCLEQVNSPPNLLSVLPTPARVHRTAERSSTGTNPPRGSTPKLGAMRPFSLHLQSLQSQMQHEWSEQSLPLPSGVRGGCSALPGYTEHLPQRFQTAPLPTGRGCNLAVHQLGVMGKIFSSSFCRKSDDMILTVSSGCKICEHPSELTGVFHVHVVSPFHLWVNSAAISELHQG